MLFLLDYDYMYKQDKHFNNSRCILNILYIYMIKGCKYLIISSEFIVSHASLKSLSLFKICFLKFQKESIKFLKVEIYQAEFSTRPVVWGEIQIHNVLLV